MRSAYDAGGVGDSNLTLSIAYVDASTTLDTAYAYDWRDRQTDSRGADNVAVKYTYDNLGETTTVQTYADADSDFVIDTGELRAQSESLYDDQGRVYRSTTREVNANGTLGDESLSVDTWYGETGQVIKTADAAGLFSKTVYDGLGRAVANYTSFDVDETDYADAADVAGDTVISVSETVYDGGRVSEVRQGTTTTNAVTTTMYTYDAGGRVSAVESLKPLTTLTSTSADYAETNYEYDAAGRQNVTVSPDPDGTGGNPATKSVAYFDLLGRATAQELRTADVADTLLARSTSQYNSLGQFASSRTYEVIAGTPGDYLRTNYEYDVLGRNVKTTQPAGAFSKTILNAWGRVLGQYVGTAEGTETDPATVEDDTIVEQTIPQYDAIGRVIQTTAYQRHDGDTTSEGALTGSNARVTYAATWFDDLGRASTTADYGAAGSFTRPSTAPVPGASADVIITAYGYDGFGRNNLTTDNASRQTLNVFDDFGRRVYVVENYVNFDPADETGTGGSSAGTLHDQDRVTKYVYNTAGLLTQQIALDANGDGTLGDDQVTDYIYAMDLDASAGGSPVPNGSLLRATVYPDGDGRSATITALNAASSGDFVETTYNAAGLTATSTDQRGVKHTYTYDDLGRLTADAVTDYPASDNFDASILRIERTYDEQGRLGSVTSFDAATSGDAVNQIVWTYDGWGNVASSAQEHDGEVDEYTPAVEYAYDSLARLSQVTYPNGRVVAYNYGAAGSIDDALGRVAAITNSGATETYAEYAYLGAGTIVRVTHPDVENGLTLDYDPDGDHSYAGWDRFGRVVDQQWTNATGTATFDQYTYEYDIAGNRTQRANALNADLSEEYAYDELNRLIDTDRGEGQQQANFQSWELDQLGNWMTFVGPLETQTRTHNDANEITGIDNSSAQVAYDQTGNMIKMPSALDDTDTHHAVYDAWNRIMAVWLDDGDGTFEPGTDDTLIATYEYDGQRRRIVETIAGTSEVRDVYFNENWQTLEVRVNGDVDPQTQYVMDLRYIDAVAVRFYDANTDGDYADETDNILHYTNDANFNVTALVLSSGAVTERSSYKPYGEVEIRQADWTLSTFDSAVGNRISYCGYRLDHETGLMQVRTRVYDAQQGVWLGRDLIGYRGGTSLYRYVASAPTRWCDPYGFNPFKWDYSVPPKYTGSDYHNQESCKSGDPCCTLIAKTAAWIRNAAIREHELKLDEQKLRTTNPVEFNNHIRELLRFAKVM